MNTIERKSHQGRKALTVVEEHSISPLIREELLRFVEYHPPGRLSFNLRKMLMEFLMTDAAVECLYLKDLVYDLDALFDLLHLLEKENSAPKGNLL